MTKVGSGEGQDVQLGGVGFTWKARGADTGFQISMYEMTLEPGKRVPLHEHPYPEIYYVLSGDLDVARLTAECKLEWVSCRAGDTVVISPNAAHTFFNNSTGSAKFLSVSTYQHELIFRDFEVPELTDTSGDPSSKRLSHFTAVALQNHGHTVEM